MAYIYVDKSCMYPYPHVHITIVMVYLDSKFCGHAISQWLMSSSYQHN